MAFGGDGGQVWNFPAVHMAASGMESQASMISGLHAEGKSVLAKLAGVWGGAGNEAYTNLQMRWDTRAEDTNTALLSLARSIHTAADEMGRTENAVMGTFAR
jgi:early secretory antigenic target protein ESAT-6